MHFYEKVLGQIACFRLTGETYFANKLSLVSILL